MTEECPYCGKECDLAKCEDGKERHYCDKCNAVMALDDDDWEMTQREEETGWKIF
jgi:ribosomal protein S27AE